MRTRGVRFLDRPLRTSQLDWLVVFAEECPNQADERRIARAQFQGPHDPWGSEGAYVGPVRGRRRRRVLFWQQSGIGWEGARSGWFCSSEDAGRREALRPDSLWIYGTAAAAPSRTLVCF